MIKKKKKKQIPKYIDLILYTKKSVWYLDVLIRGDKLIKDNIVMVLFWFQSITIYIIYKTF